MNLYFKFRETQSGVVLVTGKMVASGKYAHKYLYLCCAVIHNSSVNST
jgi:hypothetical protein